MKASKVKYIMGYRSLAECVADLEKNDHLIRISEEIDPNLEAAAIHRRVFEAGGPAILYANVKGTQFPMVSNLFGSMDRVEYMFRDTLERVQSVVQMKIDPAQYKSRPWKYLSVARAGMNMMPKFRRSGPILDCNTTISALPQMKSWPDDGGPFVTLPIVYTEDPDQPGFNKSNIGMYRVQLAGNDYKQDQEIGMHYQIHRGIGVHHTKAITRGEKLKVNVFVGGPPALSVSAVMPLPEGFPELMFAGALSGRSVKMIKRENQLPLIADADFCLSGYIDTDRMLPEGPFGDHLGYYSLAHDFPVMVVEKVYHRKDAIWPFTVVGRPPQEDTQFGKFIHEVTGPAIPTVIPGIHGINAVDASGVHPLLLAIGSERYMPFYEVTRPGELLTQANAILGQGQLSLAKYLLIVSHHDNPNLDVNDITSFFNHLLQRVDWSRDLHFQTNTTIDTLDYSGSGMNQGSKVVIAAVGKPIRSLPTEISSDLTLPAGYSNPKVCRPGILAIKAPQCKESPVENAAAAEEFCNFFNHNHPINEFPLLLLVDDSDFTAKTLNNFLWTTFTRSNPASDIYGIGSAINQKHWGCRGSLVIDARIKPHHAPPLIEDPKVEKRVDALCVKGGPLHGIC